MQTATFHLHMAELHTKKNIYFPTKFIIFKQII